MREAKDVTDTIVQCVRYEGTDLILIGARGESAEHMTLGTVAHTVAAAAVIPVQITLEEGETPTHRPEPAVGYEDLEPIPFHLLVAYRT